MYVVRAVVLGKGCGLRALLLSSCALGLVGCGANSTALVQALGKAKADACGTAHAAFPPYASDVTVCFSDSVTGGAVSVDPHGVMTISRQAKLPPTRPVPENQANP